MPIIDAENTFSADQAVTASAASTNLIDLSAIRNIAAGKPLYLVIQVTVAFTDSGSDSTVTPKLETDSTAAFSSAATVTTFDTLAALTAAGTQRIYALDPYTAAGIIERYVRLYYTVAGGDLTTGSFYAYITTETGTARVYAKNYSVS